jgi:hypothetical protein
VADRSDYLMGRGDIDFANTPWNGADILVAPDMGIGHGILHLRYRVHALAPLRLLRVIDDQREGIALARMEASPQFLRLLAQRGLGVPPLDQEEVVEARPVVLGIKIPVHVSNIPPTPHKGDGHHQQPEVREMIPVKVPFQGPKTLVKRGGHA